MANKAKDLSGKTFSRLTVIKRHVKNNKFNEAMWECACECGGSAIATTGNLKTGNTKSCGCFQKDLLSEVGKANATHRLTGSPEYYAWRSIKDRCYNQSNSKYHRYGGRGITVCDEWRTSFEVFYQDMGPRPSPEHSIDRRENDKGYSKDNCRWATAIEQANNRSTNVSYEHCGKSQTLASWCRELKLNYPTVASRIRIGWSFEEAISTEVRKRNKLEKVFMRISSYLEYISLTSKLAEYHRVYHLEGKSPIPDEEYDQLRKEVIRWETENPDKTLEISPVFKVGAIRPENKKDELRHEYRMRSLENALDTDEAQSWINLWTNKYGPSVRIVGEFKYDGMALSTTYIDGVFTRSLTRGDGEFGEDVTRHAAQFVPERIETEGTVEVRGEAILTKTILEAFNGSGEKLANSRNGVAGLLNRKETAYEHSKIGFIPYDIEGAGFVFDSYSEKLEILKQLGFQMFGCFILTPELIPTVFEQIKEIRARGDIPFDIDGMVFKIDETEKQMELGENNHSPRWAFAYKFPPVVGRAKLLDVVFQVGRTGEVAPVAKITATALMGVVVTSVSLHNEERMREKEIAIGNTYEVWRSGDVIPHMGKAVEKVPGSKLVTFPKLCPSCGEPLVKKGAAYYCENKATCTDQIKAGIAYAASRDNLDIDGLAENTIGLMLKHKLIERTADLFELDTRDIMTLPGYTEYSAGKLELAIERAQSTTFDRFISALGILDVGRSTAKKLARRLILSEVLFDLDTPEKVLELKVPDIGPSTATNIAAYFSDPKKRQDALDLFNYLDIPNMGEIRYIEGIGGKTFVFTGRFADTRDILENKVLAAGGYVSSDVSQKTNCLVVGENAGSKVRKAKMLGVEVWDERTFLSYFEGPNL